MGAVLMTPSISRAPRSNTPSRRNTHPRLVYGVTVGASSYALLRGQLSWFRKQGWDVTLVTSPDDDAARAVQRESVSFHGIPMRRDIAIVDDLKALVSRVKFLGRSRRPSMCRWPTGHKDRGCANTSWKGSLSA